MNEPVEAPVNTTQARMPPRTDPAARLKVTPRTQRSEIYVPSTRDYVLDSARHDFVQCPLERFCSHYLPYTPDEAHVTAAVDTLGVQKLLKELEVGPDAAVYRWRDFPGPPEDNGPSEAKTYRPLVDICAALAKTSGEYRAPSCEFVEKPDSRTKSEQPGSSHMIDGYLKTLQSTVPGHTSTDPQSPTSDVAVVCEFKLCVKDRLQNRKQLISEAVHGMNNDPCRNYMYGITIENEWMSVWYFSRSHCVISEPFDFTADCKRFVTIMLSFLFATATELGYDDTLRRCRGPDGQLCYVYKIGPSYYRTIKQIVEHQSGRVVGRVTRVWKAIEIVSGDDLSAAPDSAEVVIRDIWLQEDAKTEEFIQNRIFESLRKVADLLNNDARLEKPTPDDDRRMIARIQAAKSGDDWAGALERVKEGTYKDYFLRIGSHDFGAETKSKAADAEPVPDIFKPTKHTHVEPAKLPGVNRSPVSLSTPPFRGNGPPPSPKLHQEYSIRKRHFLVYTEVCVALHSLADYRDVLEGLEGAIMALRLLFLAGWVHRDVSAGNVLLYKPNCPNGPGRGKLGDLEYAREYVYDADGTIGGDPKTGTAIFMPIEIQKQRHFFRPPRKGTDITKAGPPVVHNFQHDLESIFWITLWFLARRIEPVCSQCPKGCEAWWDQVFWNSMVPLPAREKALDPQNLYMHLSSHFEAASPQHDLTQLAKDVSWNGDALFEGYMRREDRFDDPTTYHDLYAEVEKMVRLSRTYPDLKLRPLSVFGQTGTKRKADGPEEGGARAKRSRSIDSASSVPTDSQGDDN